MQKLSPQILDNILKRFKNNESVIDLELVR